MALEPITRKEKIIAGQDLTPITRMEKFLKQFGCGGGGGGSVPKPLTYDYMPEGYPTKSVQNTTLMEEQELAFSNHGGVYTVQLNEPFDIAKGQTYTVNWDGTEYERVGFTLDEEIYMFGNPSIWGDGDDTGEPFVYSYYKNSHKGDFSTLDTSASHIISVKTTEEIVTPMAEEFLPVNTKNTTVFYL